MNICLFFEIIAWLVFLPSVFFMVGMILDYRNPTARDKDVAHGCSIFFAVTAVISGALLASLYFR